MDIVVIILITIIINIGSVLLIYNYNAIIYFWINVFFKQIIEIYYEHFLIISITCFFKQIIEIYYEHFLIISKRTNPKKINIGALAII